MPFNPAALEAILDEDYALAHQILFEGHPDAFADTVGSLSQRVDLKAVAYSSTSVQIASGTVVMSLDAPRSWVVGTPVYIMADADPLGSVMGGKISAPEANGVITVSVQHTENPGATFENWTILTVAVYSAVLNPPLGLDQGGSGASSAAGARINYGVSKSSQVDDAISVPPELPNVGDRYLIIPQDDGNPPTLEWSTHANKLTEWNGSAWVYEIPSPNDKVFIDSKNDIWIYIGAVGGSGGYSWFSVIYPKRQDKRITSLLTDYQMSASDFQNGLFVYFEGSIDRVVFPSSSSVRRGSAIKVQNLTGGSVLFEASAPDVVRKKGGVQGSVTVPNRGWAEVVMGEDGEFLFD